MKLIPEKDAPKELDAKVLQTTQLFESTIDLAQLYAIRLPGAVAETFFSFFLRK